MESLLRAGQPVRQAVRAPPTRHRRTLASATGQAVLIPATGVLGSVAFGSLTVGPVTSLRLTGDRLDSLVRPVTYNVATLYVMSVVVFTVEMHAAHNATYAQSTQGCMP